MNQTPGSLVRIVDDNPAVGESIAFMLAAEGYESRWFGSAKAFLEGDDPERPGCLVLDIQMPGLTGLELQRKLIAAGRRLPIIFLTAHGDIDTAVDTLQLGAFDFIAKPPAPERLLSAVARAVESCGASPARASDIVSGLELASRLTPREEQILREAAKGLSSRVIGERLGLSKFTVDHYRKSGARKLGIHGARELSEFFRQTDAWREAHRS